MVTLRRRASVPEEVEAAERSVLGLTGGVGAMATLISLMVGDPLAVVGVPSLLILVCLARRATAPAAWAAVVAWLVFATRAPNEALLVPLAMAVVCLAIAIGPDRFGSWLRDDVGGSHGTEPGDERGWIEERLG
ncbi:MAG TPA: hypothetical protein VFW95_01590 [Candidatus Limnocylindria bacterium]|nr:hypothetical protein [Candidatus Limnocylindria bacterium]